MNQFECSDGISIAWREISAGRPSDREAVPVILHHGFAVNADVNWRAPGILDALSNAGHRVIVLDARGHGASDKPHDSSFYGEARMSQDVSELIEHLSIAAYDLVGYSMGAVVALIHASQNERIRRLVVGGVGEGIIECGGVDRREVDNNSLVAALLIDDAKSLPPATAAFRMVADAIGADREALAAQARVVHASPIRLDQIHVPTLLIAGDRDPLAKNPERLVDAIPDARLVILPGDHGGVVAVPEFAAEIVAFLG